MNSFQTISGPSKGEFRERGSRFFAFACPVFNMDEIRKQHLQLKTDYADATHICYAYRLHSVNGVTEFAADAGEPKGSSGSPILNVIRHEGLVNVAVFVIRYYGGTKLGIPGLIHAYGTAAAHALTSAARVNWFPTTLCRIEYEYGQQGIVDSAITHCKGEVVFRDYGEHVTCQVRLKDGMEEEFSNLITEKSAGKIFVKKMVSDA